MATLATLHQSLKLLSDPTRLRHESGLGIPLMRTLSDDLAFLTRPDGTTVRLTVYRAKTT